MNNKKLIGIVLIVLSLALISTGGYSAYQSMNNDKSNDNNTNESQENQKENDDENKEENKDEIIEVKPDNQPYDEENKKNIPLTIKYINTENRYNIELVKNSNNEYAFYNKDNEEFITEFKYVDGAYANESGYQTVENNVTPYIVKVSNEDILITYVVDEGFGPGFFFVYNLSNKNTAEGKTNFLKDEKYQFFDYYNGQFVVLLARTGTEISCGWTCGDRFVTDGSADGVLFSANNQFITVHSHDVLYNGDETYSLYTNDNVVVYDYLGTEKNTFTGVVSYAKGYVLSYENNTLTLYTTTGKKIGTKENIESDNNYNPYGKIIDNKIIFEYNKGNPDSEITEIEFEI